MPFLERLGGNEARRPGDVHPSCHGRGHDARRGEEADRRERDDDRRVRSVPLLQGVHARRRRGRRSGRCFEEAGGGGGYILSPSDHFFEADLPLLEAFADEAHHCTYYIRRTHLPVSEHDIEVSRLNRELRFFPVRNPEAEKTDAGTDPRVQRGRVPHRVPRVRRPGQARQGQGPLRQGPGQFHQRGKRELRDRQVPGPPADDLGHRHRSRRYSITWRTSSVPTSSAGRPTISASSRGTRRGCPGTRTAPTGR